MQIILKSPKSNYFQSIFLDESDSFEIINEKVRLVKEPIKDYIFAVNRILKSNHLIKIKLDFKKLNINFLHIYSNMRETVLTGNYLKIESTFLNEQTLKNKLLLISKTNQDDLLHKGTIRSGERISSNGDLFIFGDVNPGAVVSSKKNVYVWGKLLGIAFAGEDGNKNASIASLYLKPLQLRISDVIAIGPKDKPQNHYPEIAIIDRQSIIIKPYLIEK